MRTHFAVKVAFSTEVVASCGRGSRVDSNVYNVDCLACQKRDAYILAKDEADSKRHAAFMAQEPRQFMEPWHTEKKAMRCRNCGNGTFRMGDRTCYGHYQDYVCAECGHKESRLTETGMSF